MKALTREQFIMKWFVPANNWLLEVGHINYHKNVGVNSDDALEIFRRDLDAVIKDSQTTDQP